MDKSQALNAFWSQFGVTAYDENDVPDNAEMPRITYETSTDSEGYTNMLHASVWDYSNSWKWVSNKVSEIAEVIAGHGAYIDKIDGGYMYVTKGNPFAQRMSEPSGTKEYKRIYINIAVEFLTAY